MKRNRRAGVEDRWSMSARDEHGNVQTLPSANLRQGKPLARKDGQPSRRTSGPTSQVSTFNGRRSA